MAAQRISEMSAVPLPSSVPTSYGSLAPIAVTSCPHNVAAHACRQSTRCNHHKRTGCLFNFMLDLQMTPTHKYNVLSIFKYKGGGSLA